MKRKVLIPTCLVFAAVAVAGLWWVQATRAKAAKVEAEILKTISPDQLVDMLRNQSLVDPVKTRSITSTPESRQMFLNGMREYMALAARARREGMADDPNFKLNRENKEKGMIASLYRAYLVQEKKDLPQIGDEQVAAFWSDVANESRFRAEFDALASVQRAAAEGMESSMGISPPLQGEALEKTRNGWAKTQITTDLARADGEFMGQPVVELRRKILEAGILSSNYLAKYWLKNIKASNAEIAGYLAAHPEYDIDQKRQNAERILKRALAGEDFAKMARELSEDRGSRDNGGLYADYQSGGLWPEIEAATSLMKNGEIAKTLIESKDGFHILKLEGSKVTGGDKKLTIRHILLQKRFEDPSAARFVSAAPAPFKAAAEIAKSEIEKAKRQAFIDTIIAGENIVLPDDFEFEAIPAKSAD